MTIKNKILIDNNSFQEFFIGLQEFEKYIKLIEHIGNTLYEITIEVNTIDEFLKFSARLEYLNNKFNLSKNKNTQVRL